MNTQNKNYKKWELKMNIHSEQIDLITAALAKAQSEIQNPVKDSSNPHFKSRYADLATVLEVCREPLSKNGLAVTQPLAFDGDRMILTTILSHTSGQWIKSQVILPIQKPGSQEIGSCITYMRRYSLAALVGIFQEDDDAEAAQEPYRNGNEEDRSIMSDKQKKLLSDLLQKLNEPAYEATVCSKHKLESIYDLPRSKFSELLNHINSKLTEKKHVAA